MRYLFFPSADKKQDEIWSYTLERWGRKQAEKYITNLHLHLSKVARHDFPWRSFPDLEAKKVEANIYFSKYEYHFIFFKVLSEEKIGIISILHEKSDILFQLKNELTSLNENK